MIAARDRLTPADARTIRVLPLEVPSGTREVRIDLRYEPRTLDDRSMALDQVRQVLARLEIPLEPERVLERFWPLRNLLNLCAFDPRGRFRGRWDRNRPEQHSTAVLAEEGSDAGMVDGAMTPGRWLLCLEVHQVLTPVEYELSVEFMDEGAPSLHAGRSGHRSGDEGAPSLRLGRGDISTLREEANGWLTGELHVHSEHSDGRQSVAEIAGALAEAGVDFFALTDHNTTSGLRDLPPSVLALPGLELTTFYGHATCLGITDFVPWYEGPRVRAFAEMAADVHAAGGVISVAHPFLPPSPLCGGCRWEFPEFSWTDPDLLEIWNGDRDEHAMSNEQALALWDDLLASGRRLVAVAGADLHDVEHLKTKRYARTLVHAAAAPEAILEGLRAGRVVVTTGPRVHLEVSAGDRRHGIGETIVVARGSRVVVHGMVAEAPRTAEALLIIGGRRIPTPHRVEHPLVVDEPTLVRMQVSVDGAPAAVTNPVFIDLSS